MVVSQVYKEIRKIISENDTSFPDFEAKQLIEFILNKKVDLLSTQEVFKQDYNKLIDMAYKRKQGYPLQYILGQWSFFDLDLKVGEGVLIPRQDTETVCEKAFEYINKMNAPTVLDLCSGSGCIALSIKKYCPQSFVVAVEKYDEAFEYLKDNIERTQLTILPLKEDVFKLDYKIEEETFDVIISNPPYIDYTEKQFLQKEVLHEPEMALFAQEDGLRFYNFIAKFYRKALKNNGFLIFEFGYKQSQQVKDILIENMYTIKEEIIDISGNIRGVVAQK